MSFYGAGKLIATPSTIWALAKEAGNRPYGAEEVRDGHGIGDTALVSALAAEIPQT